MNPQAWLKSANLKLFLMASRPATLVHPLIVASAAVRAFPVSLAVMRFSSLWHRACLIAPGEPRLAPITRRPFREGCPPSLAACRRLAGACNARRRPEDRRHAPY